jgi:hypothetical protein
MTRYLLSATLVGLVAGLGLGADLKSGLEPGQPVPPFSPLNINGSSAGEKACPV